MWGCRSGVDVVEDEGCGRSSREKSISSLSCWSACIVAAQDVAALGPIVARERGLFPIRGSCNSRLREGRRDERLRQRQRGYG